MDPSATKKDNDFKKREPLHLSEENRKSLLKIIKKDAEFFKEHEIIDYSLLIGVIRKSDNLSEVSEARYESVILREEDMNLRESKLYVGTGEGEAFESYIFGIIDILTLYEYLLCYIVQEKFYSITSKGLFTGREFQQCLQMNTQSVSATSSNRMSLRSDCGAFYILLILVS